MKSVSFVEEDGTLYWRRHSVTSRCPTPRPSVAGCHEERALVLTTEFPILAPNKINTAVGSLDPRLNAASTRGRLSLAG